MLLSICNLKNIANQVFTNLGFIIMIKDEENIIFS